ncbi:hypothetical protein [Lysinibacter cavernae]|uniref:hypothetical protein n=1 Tax=Lysinibacter cavernae TaxID=1640652 RepID=UPI00360A9A11
MIDKSTQPEISSRDSGGVLTVSFRKILRVFCFTLAVSLVSNLGLFLSSQSPRSKSGVPLLFDEEFGLLNLVVFCFLLSCALASAPILALLAALAVHFVSTLVRYSRRGDGGKSLIERFAVLVCAASVGFVVYGGLRALLKTVMIAG